MTKNKLRHAIGIDLGGTKIELGIVDESGHILVKERLETLVETGPAAIEQKILKSIDFIRSQADVFLSGIGIGVAGQIHPETGTVIFGPNLNWHNVALKANIEKALKIPVEVINDVRAITMGEWKFGAGKDSEELLCVFVGTGIGCGVVSNGHLQTGCSGSFGEVGHMTIDIEGPMCTCGKQGCFEALAGGWGIAARAQEAMRSKGNEINAEEILRLAEGKWEDVTAKVIVEAYHQKNLLAQSLIGKVQKALIAGFSSLVNIYNPCRLIVGGGLIDGMPELIDIISKGIKKESLSAATHSLQVVKAQLGKEVGVLGSSAVIFDRILP